ncbi:hypothetical protein TELCIR_07506 [Teladorsagia circumcincta]|uniref:Uncharacterized protein n=1 Tax=Teladorsagia circumcincta TaxID=45464 RepID=A0A2G9UK38_TELCI|nr:hypothetical protein TELCIR_07506 [Teladorsagia circumcincta]
MFSIVGEMTMNSLSIPDQDDIVVDRLEKYCEARKAGRYGTNNNIHKSSFESVSSFYSPASHGYLPMRMRSFRMTPNGFAARSDCGESCHLFSSSIYDFTPESDTSSASVGWSDTSHNSSGEMRSILNPLHRKSLRFCQQFIRVVKYPTLVIGLLALTGISLLMVVINSLKLVFGFRSLPVYAQYMEVHTRHSLGIAGVIIESITIM